MCAKRIYFASKSCWGVVKRMRQPQFGATERDCRLRPKEQYSFQVLVIISIGGLGIGYVETLFFIHQLVSRYFHYYL